MYPKTYSRVQLYYFRIWSNWIRENVHYVWKWDRCLVDATSSRTKQPQSLWSNSLRFNHEYHEIRWIKAYPKQWLHNRRQSFQFEFFTPPSPTITARHYTPVYLRALCGYQIPGPQSNDLLLLPVDLQREALRPPAGHLHTQPPEHP